MSDSISININFDDKTFLKEVQKHVEQEVKKASEELSREVQSDKNRGEQQSLSLWGYVRTHNGSESKLSLFRTKKTGNGTIQDSGRTALNPFRRGK